MGKFVEYDKHLKELRESYRRLLPRQRVKIAKERITNPDAGANEIIIKVSAIEGILRSLLIWKLNESERPSASLYGKYRNANVDSLYEDLCIALNVERLVTDECFEVVKYAVSYRNLLAHECTYLGQDTYPSLIKSCDDMLFELAKLAKLAGSEYP
jgi:hypothetical protein